MVVWYTYLRKAEYTDVTPKTLSQDAAACLIPRISRTSVLTCPSQRATPPKQWRCLVLFHDLIGTHFWKTKLLEKTDSKRLTASDRSLLADVTIFGEIDLRDHLVHAECLQQRLQLPRMQNRRKRQTPDGSKGAWAPTSVMWLCRRLIDWIARFSRSIAAKACGVE